MSGIDLAVGAEPSLLGSRYRLQEPLGSGGMGMVYRALDRLSGQWVALKRVAVATSALVFAGQTSASSVHGADLRLALAREFQTLASLRHPHIISVLDYGFEEAGRPYFTMPLLESALDVRMAASQRDLGGKILLVVQILQALVYLHRRGILHRDLKPSNVLVDSSGNVKVLDFGVAVEHDQARGLAGTLAYLAPEVLQGKPASVMSDLYAVGVMAYEILTGRFPFEGTTPQMLIQSIVRRMPDLSLLPTQIAPDALTLPAQVARQALEMGTFLLPDETLIVPPDLVGPKPPADIPHIPPHEEITRRARALQVGDADPDLTLPPTSDFTPGESLAPSAEATLSAAKPPPRDLAGIVGKLLAKVPHDRYQDAEAVIRDLLAALGLPAMFETASIRESFLQAAGFVGRTAELEQLSGALASAIQGRGSAWLIGGENGVGKTRLLEELRIRALVSGTLVLQGQGVEGGGLPYQLWRDPVRRLALQTPIDDLEASILKTIVPDIGTLLGRVINDAPPLEGKAGLQRLTLTIVDVFRRQTAPIVLILDDLQWSRESLDPFSLLIPLAETLPLLIAGSYRDEERPELPGELPGVRSMKLPRLSLDEMAALSASILGEAGMNPRLVNLLAQETEGNALFMVEVMRALAEEAGELNAVGRENLPDHVLAGGIQAMLLRRLARVPLFAQPLLRRAAVAGRLIELAVMAYLNASRDLDMWLTACANAAVIEVHDGHWRFAHGQLRLALLGNMDQAELAVTHRVVAEALEAVHPGDESYAAVLMEHWRIAGEPLREAHYATVTGEQLFRISRFGDAATLFSRVLTLTEEPALRGAALIRLGETAERLGNYPKAAAHLHEGLALLNDDPAQTVRALNGLSAVSHRQGAYQEGESFALQALRLAEAIGDRMGIAYSLNHLGNIANEHSEFAKTRDYFERSYAIRLQEGNQQAVADGLSSLGNYAFARGEYAEARQYYEQGRDIRRAIGDRLGLNATLNNIGACYFSEGKLAEARRFYEGSLIIQREIQDRRGVAFSLNNLGAIAHALGELDRAQAFYHESLELKRELGDRRGTAISLYNLGAVAFLLGDLQTAEVNYQESADIRRALGDKRGLAASLDGLGLTAAQGRDFERAEQYFAESLALAEEIGFPTGIATTRVNRAFARAQHGRIADSRGDLLAAVKQIETLAGTPVLWDVLACAAQLAFLAGDGPRGGEFLGALSAGDNVGAVASQRASAVQAQMEAVAPSAVAGWLETGRTMDRAAILAAVAGWLEG